MSFDNVIVGLGKTGLSCARFLLNNKKSFAVMDTRAHPPGLSELKALAPDVPLYLGELDKSILSQAQEIILSPGLSVHHPVIAELIREGKSVVGDIELFARLDRAPIIAITGSNGKSTVASMLHAMAKACGVQTELGGNIGCLFWICWKSRRLTIIF
jgi:UDP-N-acetylmuramoylalanine--D-glutamate ligase